MKEKDDKRLWRRGQQRQDWTKPSVDQQAGAKMVDKHPQMMSFVCVFSLASCMSLAPISSFYLHNRKPRCGSEPNLCHWTPTRKIRPTWWRFLLSESIALSVENPLQPQQLNNRKKNKHFFYRVPCHNGFGLIHGKKRRNEQKKKSFFYHHCWLICS